MDTASPTTTQRARSVRIIHMLASFPNRSVVMHP
jgi:hypothetical protein